MKGINQQRVKRILELLREQKGYIVRQGVHYRIDVQHPTKQTIDVWDYYPFTYIPLRHYAESVEHKTLDYMVKEGLIQEDFYTHSTNGFQPDYHFRWKLVS
jgi:hypothetical protein